MLEVGNLVKSFMIKYKQPLNFTGEFIVPSFAEVWPELGRKKEDEGIGKKKPMAKMSMEYILEVSPTLQALHLFISFLLGHAAP